MIYPSSNQLKEWLSRRSKIPQQCNHLKEVACFSSWRGHYYKEQKKPFFCYSTDVKVSSSIPTDQFIWPVWTSSKPTKADKLRIISELSYSLAKILTRPNPTWTAAWQPSYRWPWLSYETLRLRVECIGNKLLVSLKSFGNKFLNI